MDIVEFNQHLGYSTPKDMVDNFSKTLAMYCITYGYEVDVVVKKKDSKVFYVIYPKDNSSIEYLINNIRNKTTVIHGYLFEFVVNSYNEKCLKVEIINKGQY